MRCRIGILSSYSFSGLMSSVRAGPSRKRYRQQRRQNITMHHRRNRLQKPCCTICCCRCRCESLAGVTKYNIEEQEAFFRRILRSKNIHSTQTAVKRYCVHTLLLNCRQFWWAPKILEGLIFWELLRRRPGKEREKKEREE